MPSTPGSQEIVATPIDYKAKIGEVIDRIQTTLQEVARRYPEGVQLDIHAPEITVNSAEEYRDLMGFNPDALGARILGMGKDLQIRPKLGLLNITGINSGETRISYRSQTGGTNFQLKVNGQEITIEGQADPKAIYEALSLLITPNGEFSIDEKTISTGAQRNLAVFDEDSKPRSTPKQRIPESQTKFPTPPSLNLPK